jgi:hypothetical protein
MQVMLPAGPLAAATPSNVTIRNNTSTPLTVSEPQINVPGATVSLQESQPGRVYNLALNFPAGFQAEAGKRVEVTVKSSNPKNPVIKIPVYQPGRLPLAVQRPQETVALGRRRIFAFDRVHAGSPSSAGTSDHSVGRAVAPPRQMETTRSVLIKGRRGAGPRVGRAAHIA